MRDTFYKTRWRLIYSDGRRLDEAPNGSTIKERWPNPVELHLIDDMGLAVQRIEIPRGYKPIFYRQRSIGQRQDGSFDPARLDATIFGYGRDKGSTMDGKLWAWLGRYAVDCPQEHIAQKAIETQLQVA